MAFDPLALTYDRDFTASPIARYLRGRVHARLIRHFRAGDHVLELGCGTGEDALFLAGRGIYVTATDASERMLAVAQAKAANQPLIHFEKLDLRYLPGRAGLTNLWFAPAPTNGDFPDEPRHYEGVFANFGVLNCLDDWRPLAAWLADRLKPGATAAFGVMSSLCLWEIVWHGLHGNIKTAARRLRQSTIFQPDTEAEAIVIRYPTVRRLRHDFAPHFRQSHVEPLGMFLPPSDVYGVIEKRLRLLSALTWLENHSASLSVLASFADHYWIEFERVQS
jgi:SAM-dependent methyltransferase